MCNKLLSLGVFSSRLKYSQINPIFKKGDRTDIANYKAISLLRSFSKNFERVIYNRFHHHLDINNILAQDQCGFQNKLSTESAVFDLINTILTATINKLVMGDLFCDFSKAFDCVNHEIPLSKLEFYGFNGTPGKLIKTYLMDRQQRTVTK
jgi:hypothetical protein